MHYSNARGVAQSDARAAEYFTRAAQLGGDAAQYALGNAYTHGRGVDVDDDRALEEFLNAAEGAHADALYELGVSYETGRGVREIDYQEALAYFKSARKLQHVHAIRRLKRRVEASAQTFSIPSPTQV